MAALTAVQLGTTGTAKNAQAATDGDTISGNDVAAGVILEVSNGGASPITVTLADPGHSAAGNAPTSSPTVGVTTVANGATKRIKPSLAFVDSASNTCTVHYSAVTSVTYELYH